ncbi:hypothetical protein Tco_0261524 [Tanacetum coccineum]
MNSDHPNSPAPAAMPVEREPVKREPVEREPDMGSPGVETDHIADYIPGPEAPPLTGILRAPLPPVVSPTAELTGDIFPSPDPEEEDVEDHEETLPTIPADIGR